MARKWFQYIGRSRLLPASFGRSTSVPRNLGKGKGEMKGKNLKFSVECYHPRVFPWRLWLDLISAGSWGVVVNVYPREEKDKNNRLPSGKECCHRPDGGSWTPFSSKRNQSLWEKWLIAGPGQEKDKMYLGHPVASGSKEVLRGQNDGGTAKGPKSLKAGTKYIM